MRQECHMWAQNGSDWPQMRQIRDFSDQISVHFGDLKKSRICLISGQSGPFWVQISSPRSDVPSPFILFQKSLIDKSGFSEFFHYFHYFLISKRSRASHNVNTDNNKRGRTSRTFSPVLIGVRPITMMSGRYCQNKE